MVAGVGGRMAKGRVRSLADFAQRPDARRINKRQVENLAWAGAFDGLSPNRAQAHHAAEIIVRHASAAASERDSAPASLFGGAEDRNPPPLPLPRVDDWPGTERLNNKFASHGLCISAHALAPPGPHLAKVRAPTNAELPEPHSCRR